MTLRPTDSSRFMSLLYILSIFKRDMDIQRLQEKSLYEYIYLV